MKKLAIKNMTFTFVILMFISAPFAVFAADMWNETPELNHDSKIESVVNGPTASNYGTSIIDMWAETPELPKEKKDNSIVANILLRHVDHFDENMYAETPDLS
jgi:hypothetical protein